MLRTTVIALVPLFVKLIVAVPTTTTTTSLNDRSKFLVLADGSSYQSGDITPNLRWQASGLLSVGCSESIGINDCYTMSLSASGDLESKSRLARRSDQRGDFSSFENLAAHDDDDLESYSSPWNAVESMHSMNPEMMWRRDSGLARRQDVKKCDSNQGGGGGDEGGGEGGQSPNPKPPAPRQRIEMFSWPGHRAGETWSFSWKSSQGSTSISSKFFHTWQLLRRDCGGGPIITLDLKGGKAVVSDNMRGCVDYASIDADAFVARTIQHQLTVTFGVSGTISYRAYDVTPSSSSSSSSPPPSDNNSNSGGLLGLNLANVEPISSYDAYGDMGDQASLKFGQYRAVTDELRDVTSYVGDYFATRLN